MFRLKLPILDKFTEASKQLTVNEYHLYSSIFEPTPKLFFELNTPYETPDVLQLYLGTSFPIQYQISDEDKIKPIKKSEDEEDTTEDEEVSATLSDPKDLIGLAVSKIEMIGAGTSNITRVHCDSDFLFFQNSNLRKAYTALHGDKIIEDIIDSNKSIAKYDRNIIATDNAATIYRTLGDTDISAIFNYVVPHFTISNGKPLFYIGLDGKINFTSLNYLFESSEKSKILLRTQAMDDKLSGTIKEELIKNYVDEEDYVDLSVSDFRLVIGDNDEAFKLKQAAYYTNYTGGIVDTTGYIFKPATAKKSYYPVDKVFSNSIMASQAVAVVNRPTGNICYECRNYFDDTDSLIKIKAVITTSAKLQRLFVAGELATIILPYAYSVYNGNYIISEIEYGQKQMVPFVELTLIRPALDLKWAEKLSTAKDSEDFQFPLAPELNKNILYSI